MEVQTIANISMIIITGLVLGLSILGSYHFATDK